MVISFNLGLTLAEQAGARSAQKCSSQGSWLTNGRVCTYGLHFELSYFGNHSTVVDIV